MAAKTDDYDRHKADWLRDELRQRDRLIAELRSEQDKADDLIRRLREHAEDYTASIEAWCETFGMELIGSDGGDDIWTWKPFWDEHHALDERYRDLRKRWNRAVPILNAGTRDVGRPLAADEEQVADVLELREQGMSLRAISLETDLSLQTVRTIIGRKNLSDRTSKKRRKIAIEQHERAHWKAQKRTGDALPKRVQAVIETGQALVKEAKGLGRGS